MVVFGIVSDRAMIFIITSVDAGIMTGVSDFFLVLNY